MGAAAGGNGGHWGRFWTEEAPPPSSIWSRYWFGQADEHEGGARQLLLGGSEERSLPPPEAEALSLSALMQTSRALSKRTDILYELSVATVKLNGSHRCRRSAQQLDEERSRTASRPEHGSVLCEQMRKNNSDVSVIDNANDERRGRLRTHMQANGGHFEQLLW